MGKRPAFYTRVMNNEMTHPCGCGCKECATPNCKTCGRPFKTCECTGKPCPKKCCGKTINFCEYGRKAHGCIREMQPDCPMQAVIPSITVEDSSSLSDLADCFVKVANINTTFYIDDKHRITLIWAGPIEVNGYDYENNPLGLRSQTVYDFENNRAVYYNKTGEYRLITLGA